MVTWYYVVGSERVGPITFEALKLLFLNKQINNSTYVWKKGFQNWERIEDVPELSSISIEETQEKIQEEIPHEIPTLKKINASTSTSETIYESSEKNSTDKTRELTKSKIKMSPVIDLVFNWSTINDIQEIFYIKIGKDRKNYPGSDIFGPYSKVELDEALKAHRINLSTLICSAGMNSWVKIQETPINQNYYPGISSSVSLNEVPVFFVFSHPDGPMSSIIKRAGVKECQLLASEAAAKLAGKEALASLYLGTELKVMNINVMINSHNKKNQLLECTFLDLDSEAKKIMLNHAL